MFEPTINFLTGIAIIAVFWYFYFYVPEHDKSEIREFLINLGCEKNTYKTLFSVVLENDRKRKKRKNK